MQLDYLRSGIERMRTQVHRQRGEIRELRDAAKADLAAASLGDAVKLCVEATGLEGRPQTAAKGQFSRTTASLLCEPLEPS